MQRALFGDFSTDKEKKKNEATNVDPTEEQELVEEVQKIEPREPEPAVDPAELVAPLIDGPKPESIQKKMNRLYKRRSSGTADCTFRLGKTCTKSGRTIGLDVREDINQTTPDKAACWERMHCDDYEPQEVDEL